MALSAEQAAFFAREGYVTLPGFASDADVAALLAQGAALLAGFAPEANPSVFSTTRQAATTDAYFLASGNNISFFLEEGALGADGKLTKPKELCVNKIGHGASCPACMFATRALRGARPRRQRCTTWTPCSAPSRGRARRARPSRSQRPHNATGNR